MKIIDFYISLISSPGVESSDSFLASRYLLIGEKTDTTKTMFRLSSSKQKGPVVIGIGNSLDETTLIFESILETELCGEIRNNGHFQYCPSGIYSNLMEITAGQAIHRIPGVLASLTDKALSWSWLPI